LAEVREVITDILMQLLMHLVLADRAVEVLGLIMVLLVQRELLVKVMQGVIVIVMQVLVAAVPAA
jgi:hypothetical protein